MSARQAGPPRRQGSEKQNDYILIIFGYCLSRPCARLRSWEPISRMWKRKRSGILRQEIRGTHTRLSSGDQNTKYLQKDLFWFQECIWALCKNSRAIFVLFDSITKVPGACPRHFDVRALNCTCDRDMRKLCKKYEHIKFHVWRRTVSESDAYVWEIVSTWSARKSIIDARREKLSLIEYGIDLQKTPADACQG